MPRSKVMMKTYCLDPPARRLLVAKFTSVIILRGIVLLAN